MDAIQIVVVILILWNVASGEDESIPEVVNIKEGSTATLNCSGETNITIGVISWAIIGNGSREAIVTSDMSDESTPECNKENVIKGLSNCMVFSTVNSHTFTSQLTLRNLTSDSRHAVIECIMVEEDEYDENSDTIWIMQSYELNLYFLSTDVKCSASLDVQHSINVFCKASKVYPDITCRIFPQIEKPFPKLDSESRVRKLPEINNVMHIKRQLEISVAYYETSCSSIYYPTEPGRYQFQIEMYNNKANAKPIATITTHFIEVIDVGAYHKQSSYGNETNTAFYTLIVSILIFAVSVFLIVSWLIWIRRRSFHCSSTTTTQNNEYESITYNVQDPTMCKIPVCSSDEGYGESTGGDVLVSDSEADEETHPQKLLNERGYVLNLTIPNAHMYPTASNAYIDPITPTSTLSRSSREPREGELFISNDNKNETHSKLCL
ncbi:unnamed protein product [Candidula unifasciata]|uniref:Ig-like domain-containing protein n=1 Tax=Candidula unifasciata TaxID=100452 RepID=A0A8S4A0S3_9EUPU|nr:unnamed protein product [Candidula unifasciata]